MDKKQFEQFNSIPKEKFVFATQGETIHDKKLDTKPTTFAKDAFRRFCKNKASVVAAVILGIIILLAIFVPVITGIDTDGINMSETFLPPKLFDAGTGFWDGTIKYERYIYDTDNNTPAEKDMRAVMKLKVDKEPSYINTASPYAKGGYVMFEFNARNGDTNTFTSGAFDISATGNYSVTVNLGDIDDVYGFKLGEYRIYLSSGETQLELRNWSTNYTNATFNLSQILASEGLDKLKNVNLVFELKPNVDKTSYILIQSFLFSADESVANLAELGENGFANPSLMVLMQKDEAGNFPVGYWSSTGRKSVYACEVYYCNFLYDMYELAYGKTEVTYTKSDLQRFEAMGWCDWEFNQFTGEMTFTKLSDACPFEEILSFNRDVITGDLLDVKVVSYRYLQLGYDSMPKFIFGTDSSGIDLLTKMFKGLRTSLILGVVTFAFCFIFGLVWGAVSGYFGGWVDLTMERFCDVLDGVPWIVVMTLCILHLGNNFGTFVLALCLTGWMGTAGLTRTQFYRFKKMEHVLAARTLGASDWRLIFKHIIPNSLGMIITSSVLMIPSIIYSEASLAYLRLGLQGMDSFGVMLSNNQRYIGSNAYLIAIPSVVMALLMISFNLFGNGLRDAVNPTLKGMEG